MNTKEIANNIKNLRIKRNITQEELAEKLFVTRQAISRWEVGKSIPDYDTLLKLCDYYQISIEELLFNKKNIKEDLIIKKYIEITYSTNKLKRIKNFLVILLLAIMIIFSVLFTVLNYNKNKFYELSYQNDSFTCQNGFISTSNKYIYFKPCEFVFKNSDEEVKEISFYEYNSTSEKLIFSGGENIIQYLHKDYYNDNESVFMKNNNIFKNIKVRMKTNYDYYEFDLIIENTYSNTF